MKKTYRMFPKISSPGYPPGAPTRQPVLVKARNAEEAKREATKLHRQAHPFVEISDWTPVEERA